MIEIKTEATKQAFLKTWPGGYTEDWNVYGKVCNMTEEEVVGTILAPFYNPKHTVLEIGCGSGYWVKKYLSPNFNKVIALDYLPAPHIAGGNVTYFEVPDRNYDCFGVEDESIDFVWSFGVFCHLTLSATQKYLYSMFRKMKNGAQASLYFSNSDRRPLPKNRYEREPTEEEVWCVFNNWETTKNMMEKAGFVDCKEYYPTMPDTIAYCKKP